MKKSKLFAVLLSIILIASMLLMAMSYATAFNKPEKPDKYKPVPATNIDLVKKISVKGHSHPTPPNKGKNKKSGAATGILGEVPDSGIKYAIVIGISDYPGEANDLQYCDDDARDMIEALKTCYVFSDKNIYSFIDEESKGSTNATRKNILNAIKEVKSKVGEGDEVVFFFSGHGMKGIADDGDKERLDEAIVVHNGTKIVPIWDGELREAFDGFATSRIIFIFDSCLAGGMKKDLASDGRVIAMASTESGYSYELSKLENGEFTYYFAQEGMLYGNANIHDYYGTGTTLKPQQVTVEEAFDYAVANCANDKPTIGDYFTNDLLP